MMPIAWDAWSSWLAARLLAGSLQGAVVVAIVWLMCRRFPAIPASVRAHAWWIVSLGLVLSLSALPPLPLPLLPAPPPRAPIDSTHVGDRLAQPSNNTPSFRLHTASDDGDRLAGVAHSRPGWVSVAIALWMAGVLVHAYRLLSAYASLRGAVRRSAPLPADDEAHANRAVAAIGLRHRPRIRLSQEIAAPLVTGIVRPVVLMPTVALDLSPRERAMTIAHELAHIRRLDLLIAWVPAIAERLFFFHPLARLAAREYATARESACDALVISALDVAPQEYGRMLVRLGVGANPMFTLGGSSPSLSSLKRRLAMLHDASSIRSSRATTVIVALVAMLAVLPLRVVARAAATPQNAPQVASPSAPAQTPAKPAPPSKSQPAAPAAPRAAARPNAQDSGNIERAIAEQRRNLQQVEEALSKLSAELRELHASQRAEQMAQELRQTESARRTFEQTLSARNRQESAARASEVLATSQFLEERLRALMAEHEQTSLRLGALAAEIDSIRQKLDESRRAQEIEKTK